MKTQPHKIVADLMYAIEATELAARAATPGPWRVNDMAYPEYLMNDDGVQPVAGGRWGDEGNVFDRPEDALHIARHDPTTEPRIRRAGAGQGVRRHRGAPTGLS